MITLKNVKYLREQILKNGYSFAGFAKSIGISRSCLDKLFSRGSTSAQTAKRIADGLKSEMSEFFLINACSKGHE